jgi:hypothetical protein
MKKIIMDDEQNKQDQPARKTELQHIRQELEVFNRHRFIKLQNSMPKMLWFQFLRGAAFGLGSVMGATLVVSLMISLLAQVEFIPIIGEWANEIIAEITPRDQR